MTPYRDPVLHQITVPTGLRVAELRDLLDRCDDDDRIIGGPDGSVTLSLLVADPAGELSDGDADDLAGPAVPEPDPLVPGIRAALGHLPGPPGRRLVQNAAKDLGKPIGSGRADRIVAALATCPWPPDVPDDLPGPVGQPAR